MFKIKSVKSERHDEEVLFFGISYLKDLQMLCLDFGIYAINLEWGFADV